MSTLSSSDVALAQHVEQAARAWRPAGRRPCGRAWPAGRRARRRRRRPRGGRCRWPSVSPTSSIWPHSSRVGVTTRARRMRGFLPSAIVGALSCAAGWAARRRPSCRCPSGRSPRRRGRRARAGWPAPGSAWGRRSPWRPRRRAARLRGRARRTPGCRPRGPGRRAARRACAPCSSRRRPGRRGPAVAAVTLAAALAAAVVAARTVVLATAALAAVRGPLAALGRRWRRPVPEQTFVGRCRRVLRPVGAA